MWALLRRTAYGRRLFAVGTNRVTAKLSGCGAVGSGADVRPERDARRPGGVVLLGYTEQVFLISETLTPCLRWPPWSWGTLLAGGVGSYFGTMAGALVLTLLTSLLTAWISLSRCA